MESKIKTSFIPKNPTHHQSGISVSRYKSNSIDLIILLSAVLLAVATVLAIGVFLYKSLAIKESENKIARLEKTKESFQPALVKELQKLSARIQAAETILTNHTAPSLFLNALERDVLATVQITRLKFKVKNNDTAEFYLEGKTGTVNSVALQSTRFGESDIIKNTIFSDIDLVDGGVTFNISGEVDLDTIRFANSISNTNIQSGVLPNSSEILDNTQTETDRGEYDPFGNFE